MERVRNVLKLEYLLHYNKLNGEPGRDRTYDNLIKSQVLYQLSYGPL